MSNFTTVIDRMTARLDALEAAGVDLTTLVKPAVAAAQREKDRRNSVARARKLDARKATAAAAASSTFTVGQAVRAPRAGVSGVVAAIDGSTIVLADGRKFAAAFVVAA